MLSIFWIALTMFVAGASLIGGMLTVQAIAKSVTVAIVKHKFKNTMKGVK